MRFVRVILLIENCNNCQYYNWRKPAHEAPGNRKLSLLFNWSVIFHQRRKHGGCWELLFLTMTWGSRNRRTLVAVCWISCPCCSVKMISDAPILFWSLAFCLVWERCCLTEQPEKNEISCNNLLPGQYPFQILFWSYLNYYLSLIVTSLENISL